MAGATLRSQDPLRFLRSPIFPRLYARILLPGTYADEPARRPRLAALTRTGDRLRPQWQDRYAASVLHAPSGTGGP